MWLVTWMSRGSPKMPETPTGWVDYIPQEPPVGPPGPNPQDPGDGPQNIKIFGIEIPDFDFGGGKEDELLEQVIETLEKSAAVRHAKDVFGSAWTNELFPNPWFESPSLASDTAWKVRRVRDGLAWLETQDTNEVAQFDKYAFGADKAADWLETEEAGLVLELVSQHL